jgi:hypothetical protein
MFTNTWGFQRFSNFRKPKFGIKEPQKSGTYMNTTIPKVGGTKNHKKPGIFWNPETKTFLSPGLLVFFRIIIIKLLNIYSIFSPHTELHGG